MTGGVKTLTAVATTWNAAGGLTGHRKVADANHRPAMSAGVAGGQTGICAIHQAAKAHSERDVREQSPVREHGLPVDRSPASPTVTSRTTGKVAQGPWCRPYMPAGAEAPAPALFVDRQGHGHFDLGPCATDAADLAPSVQKSVLELLVEGSPPLAAPQAVLGERAGAGAGMAVALRNAAAQVSAAEARARRDRTREVLLVRAKGEPKAGCAKLWTAKRRAAGAVFQPAAYGAH